MFLAASIREIITNLMQLKKQQPNIKKDITTLQNQGEENDT